jgi:dipeptidyl aminopeptidase/acylaminoacyl peptidase
MLLGMTQLAEQLYNLKFASEVAVSPNGNYVACVVSEVAEDKKSYTSGIYVSINDAEVTRFTSGKHKDSSPRFSPDSTQMVFTRVVDKKSQLFIVSMTGGEPRQLTSLKSGVSSPKFSSDGTQVAFLSRGNWTDTTLDDGQPRVVESVRYKSNGISGIGFLPSQPLALHILMLYTEKTEVVSSHTTDIDSFDWLPEGWGLVFTAARNTESATRWQSEVFMLILGKKKPRRLTDFKGYIAQIAVSPNGLRFAVLADPDFAEQTGDTHLYNAKLEQGATLEPVAPDHDLWIGQTVNSDSHVGTYSTAPIWLNDTTILALAQKGGSAGVYEFHLDGSLKPRIEPQLSSVPAFAVSNDGRIAYLLEHHAHPCELHFVGKQLSNFNSSAEARDLEHIRFEHQGFIIEGWLLHPLEKKNGKKYPLVLNVHGGPATAWGYAYMNEFQTLAAAGYAVAFCNIRGSTGYGDQHTAGINGDYLNGDYNDLMAFLDRCLAQHTYLDPKRTAIVGGSYGGLMVNWAISHTKRFKAAVTDRSICNWISFHGTSDIGYRFVPRELHGTIPNDFERLWEKSPLKHVKNVKTPCLIIHSEEDHRCPIEQAEQWFVALKNLNVPTKFVRFPNESHELSRSGRPDRRVFRLNEYLDWLEKYL